MSSVRGWKFVGLFTLLFVSMGVSAQCVTNREDLSVPANTPVYKDAKSLEGTNTTYDNITLASSDIDKAQLFAAAYTDAIIRNQGQPALARDPYAVIHITYVNGDQENFIMDRLSSPSGHR